MNGGLWCSPIAKTSRPTSSVFFAISRIAADALPPRWGSAPPPVARHVADREHTPNCICIGLTSSRYMRLHVSVTRGCGDYSRSVTRDDYEIFRRYTSVAAPMAATRMPTHHASAIPRSAPTGSRASSARMASTIGVTGWFSANHRTGPASSRSARRLS